MTTAEDCRRKAEQWLNAALGASDTKTSASMRRVSDLWLALGQRIDESAASTARLDALVKRPADLVKRRNFGHADTENVADVLRKRLRLSRNPLGR